MATLNPLTVLVVLLMVAAQQTIAECMATQPHDDVVDDNLSNDDLEAFSRSSEDWAAEDQTTTLRQVLMIHRHGDRTPIGFLPADKLANESFWALHGLSQLTNRGKARLSMLGEIMRMRYNRFLRRSVNKNQRKTRSSGAMRCIESAQVFLSSFLGLNQPLSPDAHSLKWDKKSQIGQIWQPASVYTFSANLDGMLNEGAACKALDAEYEKIDDSEEFRRLTQEYASETKVLREVLGFETDHFYKWFWASSLLEVELSYFPEKFDPRLREAYKRIEEAGNKALVMYQSTHLSKRLRGGLLINDMLKNMQAMRQIIDQNLAPGQFDKKFVHYSAHDLNLVILLGMMDNMDKYPFRPDYASNIIIELHQDDQEWFVRLFYMAHVPSEPIELHIRECERGHPMGRCTLDKFEEVMEKYKITSWLLWMQECGNDISKVDPYADNL